MKSFTCPTSSGASRLWRATWRSLGGDAPHTALLVAAAIRDNDVGTLAALIASGPEVVIRPCVRNIRPLLLAAYHGRSDIGDFLIRLGAPLDVCSATVLGRCIELAAA